MLSTELSSRVNNPNPLARALEPLLGAYGDILNKNNRQPRTSLLFRRSANPLETYIHICRERATQQAQKIQDRNTRRLATTTLTGVNIITAPFQAIGYMAGINNDSDWPLPLG